jgi:uncharacterized protein (DUF1778 family)
VPVDLQSVVGRQTFKRTLQTCDMKDARMRALVLAAGYAQAFTVLRERRVSKMTPQEVDELIARLTNNPNGIAELTLHRTAPRPSAGKSTAPRTSSSTSR